ncbi:general substrate transporter [Apiospora kogelbergensis]|uniref:general substrate transporter n=1 Tax=Apiospora kogelbergensis TaxID=1337665 RepID=UPI00312EE3F5
MSSNPAPGYHGIVHRLASSFNFRLAYSCGLITLSQLNFGMDQGAFANTQAMPAFVRKFGVHDARTGGHKLEPYFLSLLNSLPYIGFAFGLVLGNAISAMWGRRRCFLVMTAWAITGATILVSSRNRWQMMAGRIVATVYIGMELAVVPVLQSELVPGPVRGFVVATYQSSLLCGQLIQALVCRGTSTLEGDQSWLIPFGLLFVVPVLLLCGVWYLPESPRWLLQKDRPEEAMANLRLLREGRFSDAEIESEFERYKATINDTVEQGRFREIFEGLNLKRTLIVIGTNIFLQLTGQNFASIYGTYFIGSIGVVNPFTMTSINTSVNIFMTLVTQCLTDRVGRIPLMLAGATIQTGALFTMGGLGTNSDPSFSIKMGIVIMVTIFGIGFQLGWAPLSHVIAAEVPTQRLRDKTYAVGSVFNIALQFLISFSIPYLINVEYVGLGSKVGFIFGSAAFGAALFTWFCIPECSGRTLEEIDQLFLRRTPIRQFKEAGRLLHEEAMAEEALEVMEEPYKSSHKGIP